MGAVTAIAAAALCLAAPAPAAARSATVRDGAARFEVLSPTLVRLEYAADGRFEDRPTMTVVRRRSRAPRFRTSVSAGRRTIRTSRMVLRYRRGSGPFAAGNLSVTMTVGGRRVTVEPDPSRSVENLGGWRRALDLAAGPVPLHDGVLSRAGWYVLDDTATALRASDAPGFTTRPGHTGAYQDLYLFAYGHDYPRGLRDLRDLTGPAPLLPRSAFGVWFSRYWPYSEQDYHDLLDQFRARKVPLDTLSVDTDWKRQSDAVGALVASILAGAPGQPYSWNGWGWNPQPFPDPQRFLDWAHAQGLSVTLNVHPSISSNDPQWAATQTRSGGLATSSGQCRLLQADPTAACGVFDWTSPRQLDAYFALHEPFERQGVDFWWLDWCCDDSRARAPGLTADTWINSRYAARERARGLRWLAFSRIGGSYQAGDAAAGGDGAFAEHRSTIHFTGDTCASWAMLAFEAQFSAGEGNIGLPYVSHDIGSFHGRPVAGQCGPLGTSGLTGHLPDDLYARWVELGTFQPLDRLHSDHGDRIPWEYDGAAGVAATDFLRLREALGPYLYTLARTAHDAGLPMTRGLYLGWPELDDAYTHPSEYLLGNDVVVAPVTVPGDPAPATVWVPPGTWVDYFTSERFHGPATVHVEVPLTRMPVLVRAGAVLPTQPAAAFTPAAPPRALILTAYPGARGRFSLYDDDGRSLAYARGAWTWTPIEQARRAGRTTLTIGPPRGSFAGAPAARSWEVRVLGVARPRRVTVGARAARDWSYDATARVLTIRTPALSTRRAIRIAASSRR